MVTEGAVILLDRIGDRSQGSAIFDFANRIIEEAQERKDEKAAKLVNTERVSLPRIVQTADVETKKIATSETKRAKKTAMLEAKAKYLADRTNQKRGLYAYTDSFTAKVDTSDFDQLIESIDVEVNVRDGITKPKPTSKLKAYARHMALDIPTNPQRLVDFETVCFGQMSYVHVAETPPTILHDNSLTALDAVHNQLAGIQIRSDQLSKATDSWMELFDSVPADLSETEFALLNPASLLERYGPETGAKISTAFDGKTIILNSLMRIAYEKPALLTTNLHNVISAGLSADPTGRLIVTKRLVADLFDKHDVPAAILFTAASSDPDFEKRQQAVDILQVAAHLGISSNSLISATQRLSLEQTILLRGSFTYPRAIDPATGTVETRNSHERLRHSFKLFEEKIKSGNGKNTIFGRFYSGKFPAKPRIQATN